MNKENIIAVLRDLNLVSGFRVSLHGTDFSEIAAYPERNLPFCAFLHAHSSEEYERCLLCDKEAARTALSKNDTVIYRCRHGLTEIISPIYSFGVLTGYLMMGQVMLAGSDMRGIQRITRHYAEDEQEENEIVATIPRLSKATADAFVRITTICAQYLTMENLLPYSKRTVGQLVRQYIDEKYGEKILISELCRTIGYSKSTLYTSFRKEYGITINDYITEVRIRAAAKLLKDRSIPIGDISDAVGFRNQSYFSNIFAAQMKMTPSEFRKKNAL